MKKKQRNIILITGMMIITGITLSLFITVIYYPFMLSNGGGGGGPGEPVVITEPPREFTLHDIVDELGTVENLKVLLEWDLSGWATHYEILRSTSIPLTLEEEDLEAYTLCDSGFVKIAEPDRLRYIDGNLDENIVYTYMIVASNTYYFVGELMGFPFEGYVEGFAYSNLKQITPHPYEPPPRLIIVPTNPSIIINNGDLTTNSAEITLTLSCNDASTMKFQTANGVYTNWITYSTSYTLTMNVNDPNFKVGVTFKNIDGETAEVYDEITYEEPIDDDEEPTEDEDETDYTLAYVLFGVLASLIGIGIFLRYRKQNVKSK